MSVSDATVELRSNAVGASADRGYWRDAFAQLRADPLAMLGLAIVAALVVAAVFAPLLAPADPNYQHPNGLSRFGDPRGPSAAFPLGTDTLGRDELSRLLYGARVSLVV